MKIAIVAEGCYPYVTGGVSSWIQTLIKNMPQHQFYILAISADDREMKEVYEIPDNVIKVIQIPLKSKTKDVYKKQIELTHRQRYLIKAFLAFESVDDEVYSIFNNQDLIGNVDDFLSSVTLYEIILEIYQEKQRTEPFIEYFWTWKNILKPLLHVLQVELIDADVFHSVATGYSGILASAQGILNNKPVVISEHGIYAREREEDILQLDWIPAIFKDIWIDFFHYLAKSAYDHSAIITSLFDENAMYQVNKGADFDKIQVIPNGVLYEKLSQIQRKEFNQKQVNLGAIIRFVSIKDIKTMIYMMEHLKNVAFDFHLYLIGPTSEDEGYYQECLDLIKHLGLENNIMITGVVNVQDYLDKIDIILLSSISEGQPLCLMEAMAVGIPCVATNVGSTQELLQGNKEDQLGECGYLYTPISPQQGAKAIIKMVEDQQNYERMSKIAKKRVQTYYDQGLMIERFNNIYLKVGEKYYG